MHFEVPELKRFCFCFPLRYGLLVWSYCSLIITILFLYLRTDTLIMLMGHQEYTKEVVIMSIYIALGLFDCVVNIIFIIAAHLKRVKLLKTSFFCNVTFLSLYTIVCLFSFAYLFYLYSIRRHIEGLRDIQDTVELAISLSAMPFLRILFELYALLLLWNEIKKLTKNSCPIMFVNRAAEARCVMETELTIDVEENGEEDQVQTTEVTVEVAKATTDSDGNKSTDKSEAKINTEKKEWADNEGHSEIAELLEVIEATPDNLSHNVVENELFDDFDTGTAQNQKVMDDDFGGEGLGFEPW
uniref:Uncharacterized protein n=1 Tax=Heliothis virescens TaxID=7102 RepID=A0A2A4JKI2_HELVI